MGDKAAARRLAAGLEIPVVPGYDDPDQSDRALRAAASAIGIPLIVKPAAGGGGKGMRVVRELERARRRDRLGPARGDSPPSATTGSSSSAYLEGPRHVEIQVLFDARRAGRPPRRARLLAPAATPEAPRGDAVAGRRPGASRAARSGRGDAGRRRSATWAPARASSCSTIAAACFFLEMNTRLQVEHPVTELVTGRDLVADQLRNRRRRAARTSTRRRSTQRSLAAAMRSRSVSTPRTPRPGSSRPTGRVEALRWPETAGRRHSGRRRDRARNGDRRPVRPDARQDRRRRRRPGRWRSPA